MKRHFLVLISATLIVGQAFAMGDRERWALVVASVVALAVASNEPPPRASALIRPSLTGKDAYQDKGLRRLGNDPAVTWSINDHPMSVCAKTEASGRYFESDGCASWSLAGQEPVCTIVTKRETSHTTLGRLFLACQKGG